MARHLRLWITAVLSIAATALMIGLTAAAQVGVNHAHTRPALAGGFDAYILPYIEQASP